MSRWSTAVVTGASSGIGDALTRLLSGEGTDVVAVARDRDRLECLADTAGPGAVQALAADLTSSPDLSRVGDRLDDDTVPVDLFVANAGVWGFGPLVEADADRLATMLAVNVGAVVELTRRAVVAMTRRGGGTIVLVSSVAGDQPLAYESVYAATKAFVTSFGQAIATETRGSGVSVTTVLPGLVRTELHRRAGGAHHVETMPPFVWKEADEVAASMLDAAAARRVLHVPGVVNRVMSSLTDVTPRAVARRAAAAINRRRM